MQTYVPQEIRIIFQSATAFVNFNAVLNLADLCLKVSVTNTHRFQESGQTDHRDGFL